MKAIHQQLESLVLGNFIEKKTAIRKFLYYWGTTVINGEEVLIPSHEVYPNRSADVNKLLKYLGSYDQIVHEKFKGVEKYWLYITHKNILGTYNVSVLAQQLLVDIGESFTCEVIIGPEAHYNAYGAQKVTSIPRLPGVATNWSIVDKNLLISALKTQFSSMYYKESSTVFTKGTSGVNRLAAVYGLLLGTSGIVIEDVSIKPMAVPVLRTVKSTSYDATDGSYTPSSYTVMEYSTQRSYVLSVKVPNIPLGDCEAIADAVVKDTKRPGFVNKSSKSLVVMLSGIAGSAEGVPNPALWMPNPNASLSTEQPPYLFKVSAFSSPVLPDADKVELIGKLVDSDYEEKPVDPWVSFAVFVVFVVAAAITIVTGGAGSGALAAATAFASAVLAGAVAVAIVAAIAKSTGNYEVASAAGKFNKSIAPLVNLASIVLLITGIGRLISQGIKQAALEVGKQGLTRVTIEAVKQAVTIVVKSATNLSVQNIMKLVNFVVTYYEQQDMNKIRDQIKDEKAKYQELKEMQEQAETDHILLRSIITNEQLISKDQAMYAATYDRPYEWWSTPYHTGNMQRTTVDGMWTKRENNAIIV